ncbi:MAG: hypothetical protein GC137_02405 [Alphaproteobacteria bacterium]|nr:hypothetical protein [Alphaproteobacteria bacterium]
MVTEADRLWAASVKPLSKDVFNAAAKAGALYGEPAVSVGIIEFVDDFERDQLRLGGKTTQENTTLKQPGSNKINIPPGYDHMQEVVRDLVLDQQKEKGALFKHAAINFTFRQTVFAAEQRGRTVHIDPPRNENSVAEDDVYFVSNQQGTLVQVERVIDPEKTLNEKTPEELVELGLMRVAERGEIMRGTQNTYHVQNQIYDEGRTFTRIIVSLPDVEYFHNLPDSEKAELPKDFLQKHGIQIGSPSPTPL